MVCVSCGKTWDAVNEPCINTGWWKLFWDSTTDFARFPDDHASWVLGRTRVIPGEGFQDLERDDITTLINASNEKLKAENTVEMIYNEEIHDHGFEEGD